ncbi:MAG: hypothetical protein GY844_28185 [Bradyrhizobium sp.]|nr:hypothetical protein [Bradyrhizobium sp.]
MMSVRSVLRWALALAFVPLLTCAIPVGPARAADAESGIDRPGNDYKNFDLPPSIAGHAPCQSSCEADGNCKAWTWVKSGVQGPKARCWLKDAIPNPVPNNCCVSGVARPDKPIKHTGRGGSATNPAPSSLGSQVLAYALNQLGKCVDGKGNIRQPCPPLAMGQAGDGECTHLVQAALASVGARFTSGSYVWGTKVDLAAAQPGDIIQLFNAKLVGPNGWWETSSQHSAIIESVSGGVLNVLEQNTWVDNSKTNRRYVTRGTINLNWKLERGSYIIYRATK